MSNYTDNNLISVSPSNVPAGTLAVKIGSDVFTAGEVVTVNGTDTTDATAAAGDLLSGKTAYVNGAKITGTIPTVTASLSANVVTVPAGYIASAQTLTVSEAAAASVSGNVVTIPTGYIASQRTVTVGTAIAAATITPTTSDQTIAAGSYCSGAQTIKGDANLIAANIASGVTIFGVTGSHQGGTDYYKCLEAYTVSCYSNCVVSGAGSTEVNGNYDISRTVHDGQSVYTHDVSGTTYYLFYRSDYDQWFICHDDMTDQTKYLYATIPGDDLTGEWDIGAEGNSPVPTVTGYGHGVRKMWNGNKAILSNGVYTFSSTITYNLTYSDVTPQVGCVYADGALIQAILYQGMPASGLVFYAPLSESAAAAQTGQTLTVTGTLTFGTVNGIPCATFSGSQYITFNASEFPTGNSDRTISFWVRKTTSSGIWMFFRYGGDSGDDNLGIFSNGSYIMAGGGTTDMPQTDVSCFNTWRHIALVFSSGTATLYIDNVAESVDDTTVWETLATNGSIGGVYDGRHLNSGNIAAVRVYNRALTASEITQLYGEFQPT